ncbi:hypothetical protein ACJZ2D_010673 [Fusarium nematophilum]
MHFAKIFLSGIFIASVQALAFPEYPGMLEGRGESRLSPRLSPVRRLPRTPCTYKDTAPGGEGGCEFHCILEQADSWDCVWDECNCRTWPLTLSLSSTTWLPSGSSTSNGTPTPTPPTSSQSTWLPTGSTTSIGTPTPTPTAKTSSSSTRRDPPYPPPPGTTTTTTTTTNRHPTTSTSTPPPVIYY